MEKEVTDTTLTANPFDSTSSGVVAWAAQVGYVERSSNGFVKNLFNIMGWAAHNDKTSWRKEMPWTGKRDAGWFLHVQTKRNATFTKIGDDMNTNKGNRDTIWGVQHSNSFTKIMKKSGADNEDVNFWGNPHSKQKRRRLSLDVVNGGR